MKNGTKGRTSLKWGAAAIGMIGVLVLVLNAGPSEEPDIDYNNPGILEPVTSALQGRDIRIPNTDQSEDGRNQANIEGEVVYEDVFQGESTSLTGHPITRISSPNADMRLTLLRMFFAARRGETDSLRNLAGELKAILFGTTRGRIYDGFSMLNFNRWKTPDIVGAGDFPPDAVPGEYKMKVARPTGQTYISPYDGQERQIWEVNINLLYYDGQIDSDTFLVKFPYGHHEDDVLHVNYRIYSLVQEDFSPTLVMLDRRENIRTVQFPYKGIDSVWVAFFPGQVVNLTVKYTTLRQIRGVYTWGWRVHPPRIQFMQPVYEIRNAHTGEIELDPQGVSFAYRNREELTLDSIGEAAPEMKMYRLVQAIEEGAAPETVAAWMSERDQGPRGRWFEWADLATNQTQLPPEAWEVLERENGLRRGEYGNFQMISAYLNNEMYGEGPFLGEIQLWQQSEVFRVKLVNLDNHTHYFRNVDFSSRLNDDILRCCGGGRTSFEVMNFKPSYGAPKVAEMQWRAGWGFRPHFDVIQQSEVFPRGQDRVNLVPYTGGFGGFFFGYQYSALSRGGDFRFNPPPGIITEFEDPSPYPLKDADGQNGLLIGQVTEGYGVAQVCPQDPTGFCRDDWADYNPHGSLNFPPLPLQGQPVMETDLGKFPGDLYPDHAVELRFPPFLRNPAQGRDGAGDIIPPTGAWRPFLWYNPNNGTIFNDPQDPGKGYWADSTFSHGAPVFAHSSRDATIELPRASGQVFYQFDDLFHDNSIFSPHPVATGEEGVNLLDRIAGVLARRTGDLLEVEGSLEVSHNGRFAGWVSLFAGSAGKRGCRGTVLAVTETDQENGGFEFEIEDTSITEGDTLCVQSVIGGYREIPVQPESGI